PASPTDFPDSPLARIMKQPMLLGPVPSDPERRLVAVQPAAQHVMGIRLQRPPDAARGRAGVRFGVWSRPMDGKGGHRRRDPLSRTIARSVYYRDLARGHHPAHYPDFDDPYPIRILAPALSRQVRCYNRPHLSRPMGS